MQQLHREKEASQQLLEAAKKKIAQYEHNQQEVARESTIERYQAVEESVKLEKPNRWDKLDALQGEAGKWEAWEAQLLKQLHAGEAELSRNTASASEY